MKAFKNHFKQRRERKLKKWCVRHTPYADLGIADCVYRYLNGDNKAIEDQRKLRNCR